MRVKGERVKDDRIRGEDMKEIKIEKDDEIKALTRSHNGWMAIGTQVSIS
jgi:hypothetical protein